MITDWLLHAPPAYLRNNWKIFLDYVKSVNPRWDCVAVWALIPSVQTGPVSTVGCTDLLICYIYLPTYFLYSLSRRWHRWLSQSGVTWNDVKQNVAAWGIWIRNLIEMFKTRNILTSSTRKTCFRLTFNIFFSFLPSTTMININS